MFTFLVAFGLGFVLGSIVVIMLSKNNKNTIAKMRQDISAVSSHGKVAIEQVLAKYDSKK